MNELTEQDYEILRMLVNLNIYDLQKAINDNDSKSELQLEYLYNLRVKREELLEKIKNILNTF